MAKCDKFFTQLERKFRLFIAFTKLAIILVTFVAFHATVSVTLEHLAAVILWCLHGLLLLLVHSILLICVFWVYTHVPLILTCNIWFHRLVSAIL